MSKKLALASILTFAIALAIVFAQARFHAYGFSSGS
jgi:hypothetical protein